MIKQDSYIDSVKKLIESEYQRKKQLYFSNEDMSGFTADDLKLCFLKLLPLFYNDNYLKETLAINELSIKQLLKMHNIKDFRYYENLNHNRIDQYFSITDDEFNDFRYSGELLVKYDDVEMFKKIDNETIYRCISKNISHRISKKQYISCGWLHDDVKELIIRYCDENDLKYFHRGDNEYCSFFNTIVLYKPRTSFIGRMLHKIGYIY